MPVNTQLAQEQWLRFQYARDRGHIDFITKADKCEQFFRGDQWSRGDLATLKEQKRPAMTINKILPTISTLLGNQIENRVEILFRPKNGSPEATAEALTKMWMYIGQENQLPWTRSDVFADGLIRGRGFYDVRMNFDDSMKGEIRVKAENSKNVVIDPDGEQYDPDTWNDVFISKWLNGQEVSVLYNEDDGKYLASREGSSFVYGFDSLERTRDRFGGIMPVAGYYGTGDMEQVRRNVRVLERQYRKLDKQLHFVDVETGDMRPVPMDWDRNRIAALLEKAMGRLNTHKKLVKRIRWTVTADNVVLHDEWSPYKHFTVIPYFPYFRYGTTSGVVEHLLGPQEILNKVSSQELHIINTTANSGWVVEGDSLLNMSIEELESRGAQTGLVLQYQKGATPPAKIQPNQTPTGLDRVSYKAEEHIKTISNVSDSMQGFDREDVAAKAIAYKQQSSGVTMAKIMDNLERTDYLLARNCLDLIQQYYTEERIVNIIHLDVTRQPEQVSVNTPNPETGEIENDLTIGEYDITITSSPYRASIEDSQFEQARALREIGVPIPDSVLIENSRLMRRADIIKQMEGDKTSPEAQAAAALQQRGQAAEVAKTEGEANLANAKAASEASADNSGETEVMKTVAELQADRERMQMELEEMERKLQLAEREGEQKLELQRREFEQKTAMQQEEHAQDMVLREQDAAAKRAQMLRQESQQGEQSQSPNPTV